MTPIGPYTPTQSVKFLLTGLLLMALLPAGYYACAWAVVHGHGEWAAGSGFGLLLLAVVLLRRERRKRRGTRPRPH